jgi:hypothetical protein
MTRDLLVTRKRVRHYMRIGVILRSSEDIRIALLEQSRIDGFPPASQGLCNSSIHIHTYARSHTHPYSVILIHPCPCTFILPSTTSTDSHPKPPTSVRAHTHLSKFINVDDCPRLLPLHPSRIKSNYPLSN